MKLAIYAVRHKSAIVFILSNLIIEVGSLVFEVLSDFMPLSQSRVVVKLLLAEVLKKKRISKRRFAKLLGIKYGNVFRYFQDDYNPKIRTLETWAKALGVRIRDLFKE